jgi:hypothetical protein
MPIAFGDIFDRLSGQRTAITTHVCKVKRKVKDDCCNAAGTGCCASGGLADIASLTLDVSIVSIVSMDTLYYNLRRLGKRHRSLQGTRHVVVNRWTGANAYGWYLSLVEQVSFWQPTRHATRTPKKSLSSRKHEFATQ